MGGGGVVALARAEVGKGWHPHVVGRGAVESRVAHLLEVLALQRLPEVDRQDRVAWPKTLTINRLTLAFFLKLNYSCG
jgi:hypothetical protein